MPSCSSEFHLLLLHFTDVPVYPKIAGLTLPLAKEGLALFHHTLHLIFVPSDSSPLQAT